MTGTILAGLGKLAIGVAPMAIVSVLGYVINVVADKLFLKAYLKVGEIVTQDTNNKKYREEVIVNDRRAA